MNPTDPKFISISIISMPGLVFAWRNNDDFKVEVNAVLRMLAGAMILAILVIAALTVKVDFYIPWKNWISS